ncbi:hypothetical protein PG985_003697 [Apiospora marii]|uniref:Telomeric single stranded DNA binding POT1/Cdc13 domain-containing protein n=1 Tax=Apiospora marii TaxID=335849 RepID=A0ABR1SHD5_9PEZI
MVFDPTSPATPKISPPPQTLRCKRIRPTRARQIEAQDAENHYKVHLTMSISISTKDARKASTDTTMTSSSYPLSANFSYSELRRSSDHVAPVPLETHHAAVSPDELVQSPRSMHQMERPEETQHAAVPDLDLSSAKAEGSGSELLSRGAPMVQEKEHCDLASMPPMTHQRGDSAPSPSPSSMASRNMSLPIKRTTSPMWRDEHNAREGRYQGVQPGSPFAQPSGNQVVGNRSTNQRAHTLNTWGLHGPTPTRHSEASVPWDPDSVGRPLADQSSGLLVTARESGTATSGDVEAEDGEEELFNENVPSGSPPKPFDRSVPNSSAPTHIAALTTSWAILHSDIVAIGPNSKDFQSYSMSCKLRVFKHKLDEGIRIRTDRNGVIRGDRFEKNAELMPRYASADDEATEGAEIYMRCRGTQKGLKYKFLKTKSGTSADQLDLTRVLGAVLKRSKSDEALRYPRLQFWSDSNHEADSQSSSDGTRSSHRSSILQKTISPMDASLEKLERVKRTLNCTRLFVFTKGQQPAIYVLIVDETTVTCVLPPPKLSFRPKSPEKHILCIVPHKSSGETRIRLRKISDGAGIPLNLDGLLYKDLGGPEFVEYKQLQLEFHTKEGRESFQQDFNEFREAWCARLEAPRREMDVQRDPRFRIKTSVENNKTFKAPVFDAIK